MNNLAAKTSQVRIIAGRWRGRKIKFPTNLSIRPTPDRVRETVFNWLAPFLNNANISGLDLFAGSGVLGFEALSRGVSTMVFIDSEKSIITNLQAQHTQLKIDSEIGHGCVEYKNFDALEYLFSVAMKFDLIFIDPPYHQNKVQAVIKRIDEKKIVNENGLIYIEMAKDEKKPDFPDNWTVIKNKTMGQVACYLFQVTTGHQLTF